MNRLQEREATAIRVGLDPNTPLLTVVQTAHQAITGRGDLPPNTTMTGLMGYLVTVIDTWEGGVKESQYDAAVKFLVMLTIEHLTRSSNDH